MSTINCKSCGCPNHVEFGKTTIICEACGTEQTVPSIDEDKKEKLFNRGNSYRLKCDFDKALSVYESILVEYPNDPEAHWCICLCRYGIEYVDDYMTKSKIPTCHRTLYNSIFDDIDYKLAIENTDVVSKKIYQAEAERIDKIQKNIIYISQKESPYDIFICYKETDDNQRTRDSYIAEDLYNELIKKGYKIFFSRITLESKLGQNYEPIIFSALNTSKIMLVIGTKIEYFESPWVKNEWSRFLSIMNDKKETKYLIPCFRDMEAYDLPSQFLSFQSQDLNKLGAKEDLLRAIDKILGHQNEKIDNDQGKNSNNNFGKLKRSLLFIEDGDFYKADAMLEDVLNNNPECGEAYLYKVLIDYKLKSIDDLNKITFDLKKNKNFIKANRFADESLKNQLNEIQKKIELNCSNIIKEEEYQNAIKYYKASQYDDALKIFERLFNYKKSQDFYDKCLNISKNNNYLKAIKFKAEAKYDDAINILQNLNYKNSIDELEQCKKLKAISEKEKIYQQYKKEALDSLSLDYLDKAKYQKAIFELENIKGYKDTYKLINSFDIEYKRLEEQIATIEEQKRIEAANKIKLQLELEQKRRLEKKELEEKKKIKKKRIKKISIIVSLFLLVVLIGIIIFKIYFYPIVKYKKAVNLLNENNYEGAIALLENNNYSKSNDLLRMVDARSEFLNGEYKSAIEIVESAGGKVIVSYKKGNAICPDEEVFENGSEFNTVASMGGYIFCGWEITYLKINYETFETQIELKPNFATVVYDISYTLLGGSFSSQPAYRYIETQVVTIENPYKTGYEFIGWSSNYFDGYKKDLVLNHEYGNKNFVANWKAKEYVITYNFNDNVSYIKKQNVKYDDEFELITPKRDGYEFIGWYLNNTKVQDGIWKYTENIELIAQWSTQKNKISYQLNEGINDLDNPSFYFTGENIKIKQPAKIGYDFNGWTTEKIDSPILNYEISSSNYGDIHLIANWTPHKYLIYYDFNGTPGYANFSQYVYYDSEYQLATPTRNGYEFIGWSFGDDIILQTGIWKYTTDIYLIVNWIGIKYNLKYNLIGGINSEFNPSEYYYGDKIKIYEPTKPGYDFKGWLTDENTIPLKDITVESDSLGDKEFTAVWEPIIYVITYDYNGGETNIASQEIQYGTKFDLVVPRKDGYEFVGWYINNTIIDSGIWRYLENKNVKAKWSPRNDTIYTIRTYLENDFNQDYTLSDSKECYGTTDTIVVPIINDITGFVSPSQTNYIIKADGSTIIDLYYKRKCCEISFASNGGTVIEKTIQKYGVSLDKSLFPTKDNRTFDGWYMDCNFLNKYTGIFENDSIILYAKWLEETTPSLLKYEIKDDYVTINGIEEDLLQVVIPDYIGNFAVKKISKNAFYACEIKSVYIPNTIEDIGNSAFSDCLDLKDINIPEKMTKLNQNLFYNCSSLEKINIPDNIINIESYVFEGCSSLEELVIPDSVEYIGNSLVSNCTKLKKLIIPFVGKQEIRDKIIPYDTSYKLGYLGVESCDLLDIVIITRATHIYAEAFRMSNNKVISKIVLPKTLSWVESYAFYGSQGIFYLMENNHIENIKIAYNGDLHLYYYSEIEQNGYWHYVDGIPTIW